MSDSKNGYGSISQKEDLELDKDNEVEDKQRGRHKRLMVAAVVVLLTGVAGFALTHKRSATTPTTVSTTVSTTVQTTISTSAAATPIFFKDQLVDHHDRSAGKWAHKYFEERKYFKGPGNLMIVVLGGEDPMNEIGRPYFSEVIGKRYGAYTIGIEHRFFGDSYPVPYGRQTNADLRKLLTPEQAILDVVRLVEHKKKELGCGPRGTSSYCPVMVSGCSYPGLLATVMRMRHSDVFDMTYAASAPLYLYSHGVDANAYYEKVSQVADVASQGCSDAVRSTLLDVQDYILNSGNDIASIAADLGFCKGSVPEYIDNNELFSKELMIIIVTHFADCNMDFYPPTSETSLHKACAMFQNAESTSLHKVAQFLTLSEGYENCFDMMTELPPGPDARITTSDWSGCGGGPAGWMWDFLSCVTIPECGMSPASMFPERTWTFQEHAQHCQQRFGYTPVKMALEDQFHFTELTNVTHLLLTNGMNDGWSTSSVLVQPPDSGIVVINFPNGAHHSDLQAIGPRPDDTPDIKEGHARVADLIGVWLDEIRAADTA